MPRPGLRAPVAGENQHYAYHGGRDPRTGRKSGAVPASGKGCAIRTYPVAAGQTIVAKDVVNVVSGAVTKAGTPSQAIALQSGTAGQSIDIIYDGVAELAGIAAGTQITSPGVQGYAPQAGWLWVKPHWCAITAKGTYTGDGLNPRSINLGFRPDSVVLAAVDGSMRIGPVGTTAIFGGIAVTGSPVRMGTGAAATPVITITDTGFTLAGQGNGVVFVNSANAQYNYLAIKVGDTP